MPSQELQQRGLAKAQYQNDATSIVALLRACARNKDLSAGTILHDDILRRGLLKKCSDALVTMYVKCGALVKAKELLDTQETADVFTWTALVTGFSQNGQVQDALDYYEWMLHYEISPDAVTFTCALKACGSLRSADKGEKIYNEIAKLGLLQSNLVLGNALIDMYAKCGALAKAHQVLEELPVWDQISWNALISGYAEQGKGVQALNCYERMQQGGLSPDSVTFACILKACGTIGAAEKGEEIHDTIAKQGLLPNDIVLANALVDMYAKCGALAKARQLLDELPVPNVISWTALIAGYAQLGEGQLALSCFAKMKCDGIAPNAVTFTCALKACGSIRAVDEGEKIHTEVREEGLLQDNIVVGNALIDMYAKCGALTKAWQVLEELPLRNAISWTSVIAGYAERGEGVQALKCFDMMKHEGLSPNAVVLTCILKACSSIGAVDMGEKFHDQIVKEGLLEKDMELGNALVDMYAKCGALPKARQVLEELPVRNVITWTVLVAGYAQRGEVAHACACLEWMQSEGLCPDSAMLSCVLSVCSRSGGQDDAQELFLTMSTVYGVKPEIEHFSCMVNLLGHAGHLDKAVGVIERVPFSNMKVWGALLGACQKWRDVNVGGWAFEHAMRVDKYDSSIYALMASIYAAAGMKGDAEKVEAMRRKKMAVCTLTCEEPCIIPINQNT